MQPILLKTRVSLRWLHGVGYYTECMVLVLLCVTYLICVNPTVKAVTAAVHLLPRHYVQREA